MGAKIPTVLVSAVCGFVLGATLVSVLARDASAAFSELLFAELDAAGVRAARSKWQRGEYKGSWCHLLTLGEQIDARPQLRKQAIWFLGFEFVSRMAGSLFAPKPQLDKSRADLFRLLALRAEERSGVVVDPERYRSIGDRMGLGRDVDALRKMADHMGDAARSR